MKRRIPVWLFGVLIATFAVPAAASAQTRRPVESRQEHQAKVKERREHAAREKALREAARKRAIREGIIRRELLERARRAQMRRDVATWRRLRAERALARRRAIYARWYAAIATPEGRAEFSLYSERMAKLHRIHDIAEDRRDTSMVARCDKVIELENSRHSNIITVIISQRA